MANDLNVVTLIGRLTRDPELKTTPNGKVLAKFTLASNRTYKVGEETKEEVGFFDCVSWGKQAEVMARYLTKGKRIAVQGSLRFSKWEVEGKKGSKVEINVENFQFLDGKQDGKDASGGGSMAPSEIVDDSYSAQSGHEDTSANLDEDIPF